MYNFFPFRGVSLFVAWPQSLDMKFIEWNLYPNNHRFAYFFNDLSELPRIHMYVVKWCKNPQFNEMKGRRLTSAKRWIYENNSLSNFILGASKSLSWKCIIIHPSSNPSQTYLLHFIVTHGTNTLTSAILPSVMSLHLVYPQTLRNERAQCKSPLLLSHFPHIYYKIWH